MHQAFPACWTLAIAVHLAMHLRRPWNGRLQGCCMEGLEGFHKWVQVVVQGMLRSLVQAPLHVCTSHVTQVACRSPSPTYCPVHQRLWQGCADATCRAVTNYMWGFAQ